MSDASDTKSVLMFCGLHVCEFTYSPKITLKLILVMLFWSFRDMCRAAKYWSYVMHMFPAEVKQGNTLPVISTLIVKMSVLLLFFFFSFLCFL